jgi:hypothetical protein
MRVMACAALFAASCSKPTRVEVSGCRSCGPGAISGGVLFVDGYDSAFADGASGQLVRATDDRIETLARPSFQTVRSQPFEPGDGSRIQAITVDASGAVSAVWAFQSAVVAHFDSRLALMWKAPLPASVPLFVAASTDVVVASGGNTVLGLSAEDGSERFALTLPFVRGVAARDDGSIIVAGAFSGHLDLGNGVVLDTAAQHAGYVIALDSAGTALWAQSFGATDVAGTAELDNLAVGPGGEIALTGNYSGSDAELLTETFALPSDPGAGQIVALLAPDGNRLVWAQALGPLGAVAQPTSIVTDGARVLLAGGYEGTFALSASAPFADELDAYIASVSAAGVEWVRTGNGYGHERATVYASDLASFEIDRGDYDDNTADNGSLQYGDVAIDDDGIALCQLAL